MAVASYEHPESGATVVDVVCPKHKQVKGHVVTSQLGKAKCLLVLKSHKESGPDEIVDGKKVSTTRTVSDQECQELLVAADNKGKAVGSQIDAQEELGQAGLPHHSAKGKGVDAAKDAQTTKGKLAGAGKGKGAKKGSKATKATKKSTKGATAKPADSDA